MQRYRRLTGSIPVIRSTREKHCSRISAVARVAFHIYYGPTSVFILVWAAGVVLLYRATGRVLGIIAAHALWDLYAALAVLPWWWCPTASFILVVALSLAAAAAIMVPPARRYMTQTAPAT
jgi:hypothetical protein